MNGQSGLPTFLGIGTARGGSTWLHALLASHPQVYMPTLRKELHYFDRNYERGLDWYRQFFPEPEAAGAYRAIGEVTPVYLSVESCAERIARLGTVKRLIAILRNPVDRLWSEYWFKVRQRNYRGTLEAFLKDFAHTVPQGRYTEHLRRYLGHFERDQMLLLLHDDIAAEPERLKSELAAFLRIAPELFPAEAGKRKVNPSFLPKHRRLYAFAISIARRLRAADGDRWINLAKRLGIKGLLRKGKGGTSEMSAAQRALLETLYVGEAERLEALLGRDLSAWRRASPTAGSRSR